MTDRPNIRSSSVDIGGSPAARSSRRCRAMRSATSCRNRRTSAWSRAIDVLPAQAATCRGRRASSTAATSRAERISRLRLSRPPARPDSMRGRRLVPRDSTDHSGVQVRAGEHVLDVAQAAVVPGVGDEDDRDRHAVGRAGSQHRGQRRDPLAQVRDPLDRGPGDEDQQRRGGDHRQRRAVAREATAVDEHVGVLDRGAGLGQRLPDRTECEHLLRHGDADEHLEAAVRDLGMRVQLGPARGRAGPSQPATADRSRAAAVGRSRPATAGRGRHRSGRTRRPAPAAARPHRVRSPRW